jgi:hypothetical protein
MWAELKTTNKEWLEHSFSRIAEGEYGGMNSTGVSEGRSTWQDSWHDLWPQTSTTTTGTQENLGRNENNERAGLFLTSCPPTFF